jgi:hypothetical protein
MAKGAETGKAESLKRLGGGRWETRDGRFQIEPQSGTWVIVDTTQTNELGLPLVRGPFPSLTAAKEAIEDARESGPVSSPLADRLEESAKEGPKKPASAPAGARAAKAQARRDAPAAAAAEADRDSEEPEAEAEGGAEAQSAAESEPEPEPEPLWLRQLKPVSRQRARDLIEKLESLGFEDAEAIARSEIADGAPAIVRAAIRRQIEAATQGKRSVDSAVSAVVEVLVSGEDEELGVGWGLVDDRSRPIDRLDLDR